MTPCPSPMCGLIAATGAADERCEVAKASSIRKNVELEGVSRLVRLHRGSAKGLQQRRPEPVRPSPACRGASARASETACAGAK